MSTNGKRLDGMVAVVMGASKGIGAAIARRLAADGASVVVNYASSREGADKAVSEIEAGGGKAIAVRADVARKADVDQLFTATREAFGRLNILVNNAGVYQFAALEDFTEAEFHKHFDLNVLGTLLTSQDNGIVFSMSKRESVSLIKSIDWIKRFANAARCGTN